MSNVEIDAPLVNGDLQPYHEIGESCRIAVIARSGVTPRPCARAYGYPVT